MNALLTKPESFWQLFFSLVILFLTLQAQPLYSATCVPYTADGEGLQGCLDSAAAGDTIILKSGVYTPVRPLVFPGPQGNTFYIDKPLTIRGENPSEVILSGAIGDANAYNVVFINSSNSEQPVIVENLTISDGNASGGFRVGGGLLAANNQNVQLLEVVIRDNFASIAGGGLWTGQGSSWSVLNSAFHGNTSGDFGGGIAMFSLLGNADNNLNIGNTQFSDNHATNFGGAVDIFLPLLEDSATTTFLITGSSFKNNSVSEQGVRGGAVSAGLPRLSSTASGEISDSEFKGNRGVHGGAVFIDGGEVSVRENRFMGNTATGSGGGLYMDFSLFGFSLAGNTFKHNQADIDGGAIYSRALVDSITESVFSHNCAGGFGGAVFNTSNPDIPAQFTGAIAVFTDADIKHNHAGSSGGGIANVNSSIMELNESTITHNSALMNDPGIHDPGFGVQLADGVKIDKNKLGGRCTRGED